MNWDAQGYPAYYYRHRWDNLVPVLIWLCICLVFAVTSTQVVFTDYRWGQHVHLTALFGLIVAQLLLVGAVSSFRSPAVRIIPVFDRPRPGDSPAYLSGHALARRSQQLDALAEELGLAPLSTFGFGDPFQGETLAWHRPWECLDTICALLQHPVPADVKADLERLARALSHAREEGCDFALLLEYGDVTCHAIWQARQAYI
ncbi:MAG TPA: hypothetical protein VGO93_02640 [Candidatus Xenobia bacterium]|jgi:hypothetical protein